MSRHESAVLSRDHPQSRRGPAAWSLCSLCNATLPRQVKTPHFRVMDLKPGIMNLPCQVMDLQCRIETLQSRDVDLQSGISTLQFRAFPLQHQATTLLCLNPSLYTPESYCRPKEKSRRKGKDPNLFYGFSPLDGSIGLQSGIMNLPCQDMNLQFRFVTPHSLDEDLQTSLLCVSFLCNFTLPCQLKTSHFSVMDPRPGIIDLPCQVMDLQCRVETLQCRVDSPEPRREPAAWNLDSAVSCLSSLLCLAKRDSLLSQAKTPEP
ncbi:unnamed protein product [Nesidiocoris tenuis]|nr:unnamed protein product [Nesidiocoris tenuis]